MYNNLVVDFEDDLIEAIDNEENNKFYQELYDTNEDFYTTPSDIISKLTGSIRRPY